MKTIQAGMMDRRVIFLQKVTARSARFGTKSSDAFESVFFETGSPSTPKTFAASILDSLVGRAEIERQGLVIAANQAVIQVRYRTDITSAVRIQEKGNGDTVYNVISGPAVIGNKDGLQFIVEKYSS